MELDEMREQDWSKGTKRKMKLMYKVVRAIRKKKSVSEKKKRYDIKLGGYFNRGYRAGTVSELTRERSKFTIGIFDGYSTTIVAGIHKLLLVEFLCLSISPCAVYIYLGTSCALSMKKLEKISVAPQNWWDTHTQNDGCLLQGNRGKLLRLDLPLPRIL
ncbi:hypothetical protein BY458DRAFT_547908 [Sporodiniella umbellata]|nr:hypothetical protein BY458DRAFT_547908 [Sporodiniella umbellata]